MTEPEAILQIHAEDVADDETWNRVMEQPFDEYVGEQTTTLASSLERKPAGAVADAVLEPGISNSMQSPALIERKEETKPLGQGASATNDARKQMMDIIPTGDSCLQLYSARGRKFPDFMLFEPRRWQDIATIRSSRVPRKAPYQHWTTEQTIRFTKESQLVLYSARQAERRQTDRVSVNVKIYRHCELGLWAEIETLKSPREGSRTIECCLQARAGEVFYHPFIEQGHFEKGHKFRGEDVKSAACGNLSQNPTSAIQDYTCGIQTPTEAVIQPNSTPCYPAYGNIHQQRSTLDQAAEFGQAAGCLTGQHPPRVTGQMNADMNSHNLACLNPNCSQEGQLAAHWPSHPNPPFSAWSFAEGTVSVNSRNVSFNQREKSSFEKIKLNYRSCLTEKNHCAFNVNQIYKFASKKEVIKFCCRRLMHNH